MWPFSKKQIIPEVDYNFAIETTLHAIKRTTIKTVSVLVEEMFKSMRWEITKNEDGTISKVVLNFQDFQGGKNGQSDPTDIP